MPASDVAAADLYALYERALADVVAPFAFVDLDAMQANADDMLRRAGGTPIRVASKSIRARAVIEQVLAGHPGFQGILGFTLPEALWLHEHGQRDVVVAYPTVDPVALEELARVSEEPGAPVVMVDSTEHLDLIAAAVSRAGTSHPVKVCLDLDAGLQLLGGRVSIGPRRSPVHGRDAAVALAREIAGRPQVELVGLMAYEGQIAGVGDDPANAVSGGVSLTAVTSRVEGLAIRAMQAVSGAELRRRRADIVAGVREVADLAFVNGGGTGSLETTAVEDAVTEVAAGSGFFAPHLFDHYTSFTLRPAAGFALPIVRRPGPGVVTALGGGYLASGPADALRLPVPWLPPGLSMTGLEGAGEVQTPLTGAIADDLAIGDRVYLRHTKAGELCERFASLYLVRDGEVVDEVPTYRGEGQTFL